MNKKAVEIFKSRISEHFYNEAKILNDLLESNLSPSDWIEIKKYMEEHPYHELYCFLKKKQAICSA